MDQQNTNILLDISDSRDTAQRADVPDRNEDKVCMGYCHMTIEKDEWI